MKLTILKIIHKPHASCQIPRNMYHITHIMGHLFHVPCYEFHVPCYEFHVPCLTFHEIKGARLASDSVVSACRALVGRLFSFL